MDKQFRRSSCKTCRQKEGYVHCRQGTTTGYSGLTASIYSIAQSLECRADEMWTLKSVLDGRVLDTILCKPRTNLCCSEEHPECYEQSLDHVHISPALVSSSLTFEAHRDLTALNFNDIVAPDDHVLTSNSRALRLLMVYRCGVCIWSCHPEPSIGPFLASHTCVGVEPIGGSC